MKNQIKWKHVKFRGYETKVFKDDIEYEAFIILRENSKDGMLTVWSLDGLHTGIVSNTFVLHSILPHRRITSTASRVLKKAGFVYDHEANCIGETMFYLISGFWRK